MSRMIIEYVEGFSTKVISSEGKVAFTTDAPKDNGGKGENLSPTDLFAVSLGCCILTIMGMYAKKFGVDFTGVEADVVKSAGSTGGGIAEIIVNIYYPRALEGSLREKMEKAAKNCPIHHCIDPKIKQEIVFHYDKKLNKE